jgi:hypothetical protein
MLEYLQNVIDANSATYAPNHPATNENGVTIRSSTRTAPTTIGTAIRRFLSRRPKYTMARVAYVAIRAAGINTVKTKGSIRVCTRDCPYAPSVGGRDFSRLARKIDPEIQLAIKPTIADRMKRIDKSFIAWPQESWTNWNAVSGVGIIFV